MKYYQYFVIVFLTLLSLKLSASANTFIRETERLVALSDKTYTVIVSQYEQTFSYWSGKHRLLIRVIDLSTNALISEVLLSSVQADRSSEEPFDTSFSLLSDEDQAMENSLIQPQVLFKNLQYPKYRFYIDKKGVYIKKEGRQDILDFSVIESRFSNAGSNIKGGIDAYWRFDLNQVIESNDLEFTGWYKSIFNEQALYFLVLKNGRHDDDTGSLEYVFSIPAIVE